MGWGVGCSKKIPFSSSDVFLRGGQYQFNMRFSFKHKLNNVVNF